MKYSVTIEDEDNQKISRALRGLEWQAAIRSFYEGSLRHRFKYQDCEIADEIATELLHELRLFNLELWDE